MAQARGVDVRRVFLLVFAVGSLIGGIAALFNGMRFAAQPDMGNTPVFYAFVVAFVAGVERSPRCRTKWDSAFSPGHRLS